jgi:hypothetical protein
MNRQEERKRGEIVQDRELLWETWHLLGHACPAASMLRRECCVGQVPRSADISFRIDFADLTKASQGGNERFLLPLSRGGESVLGARTGVA